MNVPITIDEVDGATRDEFRAEVDRAISAASADSGLATLDFAHVRYFGSAGVAVLAQALPRLPAGGRLRVVNATPTIVRVFQVTGLDGQVDVQPSAGSADSPR